MGWEPIPLYSTILGNVDETALTSQNAKLENCYITEVGSLARFPRLNVLADTKTGQPLFLYKKEFRGDLYGVSGGHLFRFDQVNGTCVDLTAAVVEGGNRVTFAETDDGELVMAAGGPIVGTRGDKTSILSPQAPNSTHVAFCSGFLMAIEGQSGRFQYSAPGIYNQWDALDVLAGEGVSDDLNSLIVTEYNELLLGAPNSIEQFDAAPSGTTPFFLRWNLGTGVWAPYTMISVDNRTWVVNKKLEWESFASQLGNVDSADIQHTLENIDDWTEAWAQDIAVMGQRFVLLAMPFATNIYGTKGICLCFDYRKSRWGTLYSWDDIQGLPIGWQGRSAAKIGPANFIGGNDGKLYTFASSGGDTQRMLWRSGFIDRPGGSNYNIEELRMRIKRGVGGKNNPDARPPMISLRANKDNRGFGRSVRKSLGFAGQNEMTIRFPKVGKCRTVQYEIEVTDDCDVQLVKFEMNTNPLG